MYKFFLASFGIGKVDFSNPSGNADDKMNGTMNGHLNGKPKGNEKKGLQVIGVGLPRTGTMSLQKALEILGYAPCHHFKANIVDPGFPWTESRRWQKACNLIDDKAARQKILRSIFEGGIDGQYYPAGVDYPTSSFVDDLVEMYPNAKFIHGLRSSPQTWRKSFNSTLGVQGDLSTKIACFWLPVYALSVGPLMSGLNRRCQSILGGNKIFATDDDVELYHRHNAWVRELVPKGQLLEYQPGEGWEPLCKFLDVPVPVDETGKEIPYPNVNDREQLKKGLDMMFYVGCAIWVLVLGAFGGSFAYFGLVPAWVGKVL